MSRIGDLTAEKAELVKKIFEDQKLMESFKKSITKDQKRLSELNKEIKLHKVESCKISDHALLRYLCRIKGHKNLINQAISELQKVTKNTPTNGKWPIGNGNIAIIRDGVVVTITNEEDFNKPTNAAESVETKGENNGN